MSPNAATACSDSVVFGHVHGLGLRKRLPHIIGTSVRKVVGPKDYELTPCYGKLLLRATGPAALDWFIAQWDDKQKLVQALGQTSQIRLDQADRESWDKYGTDKEYDIPLLPGASRIRFGACDEQSGATGSVTITIKSLAGNSQ